MVQLTKDEIINITMRLQSVRQGLVQKAPFYAILLFGLRFSLDDMVERVYTDGERIAFNPDFLKAPAVARNEETVLGLMLLFPNHRKKVFTEKLLVEEDFITDLNKRIFTCIGKAYAEGDEHLISLNDAFTNGTLFPNLNKRFWGGKCK